MASTSALKLDLYFPETSTSSSSSSSSTFRVPPKHHWPIDVEADSDNDDDGWGIDAVNRSSEAAQGKRWLTAMTSWQATSWDSIDSTDGQANMTTSPSQPLRHRSSMSSIRSNRSRQADPDTSIEAVSTTYTRRKPRLGGTLGTRVAIGTAQGTVWIFAQCPPTTAAQGVPTISTPPEASHSREFNKQRASSPSPSIASQSSRSTRHGHGRESISLPPFAGFTSGGHQHSIDIPSINTITSPTLDGSASSTTEGTSISNVSPTAWKAASPSSSTISSNSHALESRLEAQYHAGSNRDSALGGMMEALGLSKHHHHHHHSQHTPASSRSPEHSGHATPARVATDTSSNRSAMPPPKTSRRHVHNRASAITGTPLDPSTLSSSSRESRHVSAESSHLSSRRPSAAASIAPAGTGAEGTSIDSFKAAKPVLQIRLSENSPIASLQAVTSGPEQTQLLFVLQTNGLLSAWSLEDGCMLGQIHLAKSESYLFDKTSSDALHPPPTNNALAGLSTPLAALAALRSHTNSPALSASSKVGATGGVPSGTGTPRREREAVSEELHQSHAFAAKFHSMEVLNIGHSDKDDLFLACYDRLKQRYVFLTVNSKDSKGIDLQPIASAQLPPGTKHPSALVKADASQNTVTAQVFAFDPNSSSIVVQEVSLKTAPSAAKPVRLPKADSNAAIIRTVALPEEFTETIRGMRAIWTTILMVWSDSQCQILRLDDTNSTQIASLDIAGVEDIELHPSTSATTRWATVTTTTGLQLLEIITGEAHSTVALALTSLDDSDPWSRAVVQTPTTTDRQPQTIAARVTDAALSLAVFDVEYAGDKAQRTTVFQSASATSTQQGSIKALLPLTMEKIVVITAEGNALYASLSQLVSGGMPNPTLSNAAQTQAQLTCLLQLVNPRTQAKYIFAGYASGDVAFWDASTLQLIAQWSLFTVPVSTVHAFGSDDSTHRLSGCAAITGEDGTGAIVLLDGLKLLSLIPGRGVPLERIAVRADDLLLLYGDERARVWDMASQELRRSIGLDQALALLRDGAGAWTERRLIGGDGAGAPSVATGVLSSVSPHSNSAVCMAADFRKAIEAAAKAADGASGGSRTSTLRSASGMLSMEGSVDGNKTLPLPKPRATRPSTPGGSTRTMSILRPIMSALWPWHLDAGMDDVVCAMLQIKPPVRGVLLGLSTSGHRLCGHTRSLTASVCASASQLLVVMSMLEVLARLEESRQSAHTLMSWVTTDLPLAVGPDFQAPSLATLALHLADSSPDIQSAAQALFSAQVRRLTAKEMEAVCAAWSPCLGCTDPAASAQALALLGFLSLECYTSMDPNVLKDVAKALLASIENDKNSAIQLVGLRLCIGGFSVWQQYIDAMHLLRLVSALAMEQDEGVPLSKEKEGVIALARRTTLEIAEENTPLFMTTLHLDILQASSANAAAATMRLVAFIVRRKPLILYPNLPRLAEAVVKSLDPTSPMREAVLQSATMMISELIATYPSIAFHNKLQRLAIGTHEGAAILYDLKTATRLFILEGHKKKVDGLSFSPDGRRLVTMSLAEGRILVWKVGSSLAGFFAPGSMPKQGGNDPSGAYKSVAFAPHHAHAHERRSSAAGRTTSVYDEVHNEEELPRIDVEWRGEKDVKVDVMDVSMSFNVA